MGIMTSWKEIIGRFKTDAYALYLVFKDGRTHWYVKAFLILVVAYALSPIDLIPDFIPVIGYLDDLIIVGAGFYLAIKMVPRDLLEECRRRATTEKLDSRAKWIAAAVIIFFWLLVIYLIIKAVWL
jgi:uncharacterized membrane protein YkvA (DUF1232 family)